MAPEGSLEHTHALGCLLALATSCKQDFWRLPGLSSNPEASSNPEDNSNPEVVSNPEELVQQLAIICWRWLRNEQLLRLLLKVLLALAESLLPHCASPVDEEDEAASAAAAGCKKAVGVCLRLLLVTLPGSSQVPLMIRGLALQVGCKHTVTHFWLCGLLLAVPGLV